MRSSIKIKNIAISCIALTISIALLSCSKVDEVKNLEESYSLEKWTSYISKKYPKNTVFEENGKSHITLELNEYSAVGSTEREILDAIRIIRINQIINGDFISVVTKEAKDSSGNIFMKNAMLITIPLESVKDLDVENSSSTYEVYNRASDIVIISSDVKRSIANRCKNKSFLQQVPSLCAEALR